MKNKNIVILSLVFMITACVSSKQWKENTHTKTLKKRTAASQTNLEGTYLAVANYINHERKPVVRIYLNEIETEPGSYYAILLEYRNLLKVFPKYVTSNKFQYLSKKIGFLNHIIEKIWLYKVVPSNEPRRFNMLELRADNKEIKAIESKNPRQLVLSKNPQRSYPLEGAKIYPSKTGQSTEIFFPKKSAKSITYGKEFFMAHLVYHKINLDSTWRNEFLPGPYLSAYGNKDDIVLRLDLAGESMHAYFVIHPDFIYTDLNKKQIEKRKKVFTNSKSAFLEGGFIMREPIDGMFVFSPMYSNKSTKTIQEITGRIGVFVDIFDATKKLNQDVVELIMVNTKDPLDFHMHYEDPENGDGEGFEKN